MEGSDFDKYKIHADVVREVGLYSLKALITVNAGAIISLLTVFPKVAGTGVYRVDMSELKFSLGCYLAGIGCVFLSLLLTLISAQLSCSGKKNGWLRVILTILLGVCSLFCFAIGAYFSIDSLEEVVKP